MPTRGCEAWPCPAVGPLEPAASTMGQRRPHLMEPGFTKSEGSFSPLLAEDINVSPDLPSHHTHKYLAETERDLKLEYCEDLAAVCY